MENIEATFLISSWGAIAVFIALAVLAIWRFTSIENHIAWLFQAAALSFFVVGLFGLRTGDWIGFTAPVIAIAFLILQKESLKTTGGNQLIQILAYIGIALAVGFYVTSIPILISLISILFLVYLILGLLGYKKISDNPVSRYATLSLRIQIVALVFFAMAAIDFFGLVMNTTAANITLIAGIIVLLGSAVIQLGVEKSVVQTEPAE